ncbi:hypothetical protein [Paenibacillus polymyxa]|nr:hypothetical protein [Paenibacillus polymyxa]
MKKKLARLAANRLTKDAEIASRNEKTIIGAIPLPKELKKK